MNYKLKKPLFVCPALHDTPSDFPLTSPMHPQIHLDYLRAGADVITTVTYQASIAGLEKSGLTGDAITDVLRSAVTLAAEARSTFMSEQASAEGKSSDVRVRPLIAYSCGSYGACLSDGSEFHGNYAESVSIQELKDFHRMRIEPVRNDPNVDMLAFETVPCLKEAIAIAELMQVSDGGRV